MEQGMKVLIDFVMHRAWRMVGEREIQIHWDEAMSLQALGYLVIVL